MFSLRDWIYAIIVFLACLVLLTIEVGDRLRSLDDTAPQKWYTN